MSKMKRKFLQRGLTLVEIIVAMAIMMVVLSAVLLNMSSSSKAGVFQRNYSQVMENGQTALNLLTHYIRSAGYQQFVEVPLNEKPRFGQSMLGCQGKNVSTTAGSIDTWGAECNGVATTSDSLAVRYQGGSELVNLPGLTTGSITTALQDCAGVAVTDESNQVDRGDGTKMTIVDNRFFIDGNDLICHGNGGAGGGSATMVTGIQEMRFWYGVAEKTKYNNGEEFLLPQVVQYMTASELSAKYGSESNKMWEHVVSVRICVVANSSTGVVPAGAQYTDCSGNNQDMDNILRRAMYTTIDVPNAGVGV